MHLADLSPDEALRPDREMLDEIAYLHDGMVVGRRLGVHAGSCRSPESILRSPRHPAACRPDPTVFVVAPVPIELAAIEQPRGSGRSAIVMWFLGVAATSAGRGCDGSATDETLVEVTGREVVRPIGRYEIRLDGCRKCPGPTGTWG